MDELRIIINKGKEYQAVVENIYRKDTFFREVYKTARDCMKEILYVGKTFDDPYDKKEGCSDARLNEELMGYSNNLIAFCANRGQGKTSTMVSFADSLKNIHRTENLEQGCDTKEVFWNGTDVMQYHYEVLSNIDPTAMEHEDSILKVILSRMFNHFQEVWESVYEKRGYSNSVKNIDSERNKLARLFQKAFHSIQTLNGAKKYNEDDELEQIMEMGDSSNLRGLLYRLVREYLSFICGNKDSYLVLQIDDADLNIEKTYSIIEDIRKYLVMPRVIILMAVNMAQLESTVEQYFISQYLVNIKNGGMVDVEVCHEIAERYIDKVIPGRRQIYLPSLKKMLAEGYENVRVKYLERDRQGNIINKLEEKENWNYQDQLLDFIRKRTGLVLMNPKVFLHNILPGNMRGLTHFLVYFGEMEEISIGYSKLIDMFSGKIKDSDRKELDRWKRNLTKFQHYLVDVWSAVSLREKGRRFLKNLSVEPIDNKNRHVLKFLPDYYGSEREEAGVVRGVSLQKANEYREMFISEGRKRGLYIDNETDSCEHASYADVYTALSILRDLPGWNRQYRFAYAVSLYYSIQMHLLLIEQIENCMNQKENNSLKGLSAFMKDVLFRSVKSDNTQDNIPYEKYEIDEGILYGFLNRIGYKTQEDHTWIEQYCRREIRESKTYRTVHTTINEKKDSDRKLVFNIFYPMLYNLDMLSDADIIIREQYSSDEILRSEMIVSFMVLLNWDVQYMLTRAIREHRRENTLLLSEFICDFYGRSVFKQVLLEASVRKSDRMAVELFVERYSSEAAYRKYMFAIQMSCAAMDSMTQDYYTGVVKRLKESKEEMKELFGDQNTDKSIEELFRNSDDLSLRLLFAKSEKMDAFTRWFTSVNDELEAAKLPFDNDKCIKIERKTTYAQAEQIINTAIQLLNNELHDIEEKLNSIKQGEN